MNDKMKIESDIPVPPVRGNTRFPLAEMNVGDSFLANSVERNQLSAILTMYAKKHDKKFTTRKIADGVRVWRVK